MRSDLVPLTSISYVNNEASLDPYLARYLKAGYFFMVKKYYLIPDLTKCAPPSKASSIFYSNLVYN